LVLQVVGSADATLHALEYMDRLQPVVRIDPGRLELRLPYQTMRQLGGTYQQVLGPSVAKLEGTYRWLVGPGRAVIERVGPLPARNHAAVAAGLPAEYFSGDSCLRRLGPRMCMACVALALYPGSSRCVD
jgi:hypothetical protein